MWPLEIRCMFRTECALLLPPNLGCGCCTRHGRGNREVGSLPASTWMIARWLQCTGPEEWVATFQELVSSLSLTLWGRDLHEQWCTQLFVPPPPGTPDPEATLFSLSQCSTVPVTHFAPNRNSFENLCELAVAPEQLKVKGTDRLSTRTA